MIPLDFSGTIMITPWKRSLEVLIHIASPLDYLVQEDAAAEISKRIADFVNSLPPSSHGVGQLELPKHTEEILLEKMKESASPEPSYTKSKPDKIRDLQHSHGQAYMGGPGQPHGVGHGGWVL